jgi:hypothetical protein
MLRARGWISVVVGVVLLAGCSGGGSSSGPVAGGSGSATPAVAVTAAGSVAAGSVAGGSAAVSAAAPSVVAPGSRTPIAVSIQGATVADGTVAVALDGPGAVDVTVIRPTPGTVVFTASTQTDVTATITLTATKPAGATPKTLVIKTSATAVAGLGAFHLYGDNQDVSLDGVACDLAKPFTLKFTRGMRGTMTFIPKTARAGSMTYSGTLTNAPMTANGKGPYTIELDSSGAKGTLTYTQSGQVVGGGASTSTWKLTMVAAPACTG